MDNEIKDLREGVLIKDLGKKRLLVIDRKIAEKLLKGLTEWLENPENKDTHYALPIVKESYA